MFLISVPVAFRPPLLLFPTLINVGFPDKFHLESISFFMALYQRKVAPSFCR